MTARLRRRLAVLAAAMVAAAVVAVVGADRGDPGAAEIAPAAAAPPATAPDGARDVDAIEGTVAEKLDVTQYSYLRLTLDDGAEIWAAVPRTGVAVGAKVTLREPQLMEGFVSPTLGRAFDRIFFGSLAAGAVPAPAHHADGAQPAGGPGGAGPAPAGGEAPPRPALGTAVEEPEVGVVAPAGGPNGHTIAQLHLRRGELSGKPVRVRGVVVRTVPGVLGRSFVHLRDGSGDAARGTHDLTITTVEQPEPGQTVLLEGTLTVDRDFGAGYRYPVLLEDARSVTEP